MAFAEKLEADFKVKINDIRGRIDIDVNRKNNMTEAKAKESLIMEVFLPNQYLMQVALELNCEELHMSDIDCDHVEFHGKVKNVFIASMTTFGLTYRNRKNRNIGFAKI